MTEKLKFTRAQIRNMAIIAKEEGVNVMLSHDGFLSVQPATAHNLVKATNELKDVILL